MISCEHRPAAAQAGPDDPAVQRANCEKVHAAAPDGEQGLPTDQDERARIARRQGFMRMSAAARDIRVFWCATPGTTCSVQPNGVSSSAARAFAVA